MTTEQAKHGTDAGEIDVNDEAQCIHWTHELGVTADGNMHCSAL